MKRIFWGLIFLGISGLSQAADVNVLDHGAVSDGTTLTTSAFQVAIDQAHDSGGGTVTVPAGQYLCGAIVMKSGVELHLEEGATILGSTNPDDYFVINRWKGLIMADHASNISITGSGTIDGQGAALALRIDSLFYAGEIDSSDYEFRERRPKAPLRPQVIEFVDCQDIVISGITIRNGASWVQTYYNCRNLLMRGIRVESTSYWNNDGVDLVNCQNVLVSDSYFNTSDDAICLKTYTYKQDGTEYCDSILITDCVIRSSASAVKIGTASYGDFTNITIRNIKVYDTFRSAIALESVNGGSIKHVLVENIQATNTGNALFVRLGKRSKKWDPGVITDVTIRNMQVEVPLIQPDQNYELRGPALPFFHNIFPSSIVGIPGHSIEDLTLENIQILYPGKGNPAYANMPLWRAEQVPEEIAAYPEFSMFGELPAWGLYLRHVKGLTLRNIQLSIEHPDYRTAIVGEDVEQLQVSGLDITGAESAGDSFFLNSPRLEETD